MPEPGTGWAGRDQTRHLADQITAAWQAAHTLHTAPDSPDPTLTRLLATRRAVVGHLIETADLTRAIDHAKATLTDDERVLGRDHPDIRASRNSLAGAYRAAGHLGRAIPLYEQTLTRSRSRLLWRPVAGVRRGSLRCLGPSVPGLFRGL